MAKSRSGTRTSGASGWARRKKNATDSASSRPRIGHCEGDSTPPYMPPSYRPPSPTTSYQDAQRRTPPSCPPSLIASSVVSIGSSASDHEAESNVVGPADLGWPVRRTRRFSPGVARPVGAEDVITSDARAAEVRGSDLVRYPMIPVSWRGTHSSDEAGGSPADSARSVPPTATTPRNDDYDFEAVWANFRSLVVFAQPRNDVDD